MSFAQSGNSGNEGVAAPAAAPSANDAATTQPAKGDAADTMTRGLAFMSMTHNRGGDDADTGADAGDGADDTTTAPTAPGADKGGDGADSRRPADGSHAGSEPGAPDVSDMQSQLMALQAEIAMLRNNGGQQAKPQEQQAAAKPARKEPISPLSYEGEPDEFVSRQEMFEREKQLTALMNQSLNQAYSGIIGSEKQRFYSDYEASRREHGAEVADLALTKQEVDEIWRQYEADAVTHGFGKNWKTGFDSVIRQRAYDPAKSELAKKDAEIAKLKKQVDGQQATKRQTAARLTSGGGNFQEPNTGLKHGVVRSYKSWRPTVVRDMRRNG